jgi:hypothetical protein
MDIFKILNSSKLFLGITMLMMNIGGKYIAEEIPQTINKFFTHKYVKSLFVFSIIFIGTRDINISLIITLLFYILFKYLFEINSKSCILPKYIIDIDFNKDGKIDANEIRRAKQTLNKYSKQLVNKYIS